MNYKALNTNGKMKDLNIRNAFKLKMYQILIFLLRTGQRTIPMVFKDLTELHIHILHGFVKVIIMKNLSNSITLARREKLTFNYLLSYLTIFSKRKLKILMKQF